MARLTGKKYAIFIGGFVGLWVMIVYPAILGPYVNPEPYKKNRERIPLTSNRET